MEVVKENALLEQRKRLALQVSMLFLINVIAMGSGTFALLCGLFTENYVAAAFPALVALLLSAWQPWLILLCMIPYGATLAPFVSVPITLAVYRPLLRKGKLRGLRNLVRQPPRRVAAWVVGGLLVGILVSYGAYKDIIPQHRGVPKPLSRRLPQAAAGMVLNDSRYYLLSNFLDTHFLWRARVSPANAAMLLKRLDLQRVKDGTLEAGFWNQAPLWWQEPKSSTQEYKTGTFSVTGLDRDGWHAGAVYVPQTETLYLWGKDNF